MSHIIITVLDETADIERDLQVPDDLEIEKLTDDILQTLMGADPLCYWDERKTRLEGVKLQRLLSPTKTLREEGIWNGDYIRIHEEKYNLDERM